MPNIITIEDYRIEITKHNFKNMYIGVFVNTSEFPKIYGDSVSEIISQAEELIRSDNNELRNN